MPARRSKPMKATGEAEQASTNLREPLLRTKLFIPFMKAKRVSRADLVHKIDDNLDKAVILVSAPAGFGKTTILVEWTKQARLPVAWLSLDAGDNDINRFLRYVIAALKAIPGNQDAPICTASLGLLQSIQPTPTQTILIAFINDLMDIPGPFVLVLDDYQFITGSAMNEALTYIIEHLPPQVHLIVSSRVDPSIPLHRLRASQSLLEIRTDQLRFTEEEAEAFMNRVMNISLSRVDISSLVDRTEGWVAGLQMAALSMRDIPDRSAFIHALSGSHRYILEYLLEEVLNRQPENIQAFLLQTSILDQLCQSLCDAVTGEPGQSQQILEYLERSNIFLIALDEVHSWYRYHHLFANLLEARLEQCYPERLPRLHMRASQWYEEAGIPETAVQYALSAKDPERAAHLVEQNAIKILSRGEMSTLLRLFESIPETILLSWPKLSVLRAWTLTLSGQLESAEAQLADLENRFLQDEMRQDRNGIQGSIALMQGLMADFRGDMASALMLARRADDLLPEDSLAERSIIPFVLGDGYFALGELDKAEQAFRMIQKIGQVSRNLWTIAVALNKIALLKRVQGKLNEAWDLYKEAVRMAGEGNSQQFGSMGAIYVGMSELLRERNDLWAAHDMVTQAIKNMARWQNPTDLVNGYCTLARICQSQGLFEQADAAFSQAEEISQTAKIFPITRLTLDAYQVRFWLATGNSERVKRWWNVNQVNRSGVPKASDIDYANELEWITVVRVMIARSGSEAAQNLAALKILDILAAAAVTGGRFGRWIEIQALMAAVLWRSGKKAQAYEALDKVLSLAESEGYVHTFVDEGRPMEELLQAYRLRSDCSRRAYIDRLLNAFQAPTCSHKPQDRTDQVGGTFTNREVEVLQLLAAGLSNQEIADRLVLSQGTIKTHTHNLYRKLGVQSRTRAVARAKELGFI